MKQDDSVKKRMLIFINNNTWPIKNLFLSGAIYEFQKYFNLTILVSSSLMKGIQTLAVDLNLNEIDWVQCHPFVKRKAYQFVCQLQKAIIYERHNIATERIKQRNLKYRNKLQNFGSLFIRLIVHNRVSLILEKILAYFRFLLVPHGLYTQELIQKKIDIVFITDPLVERSEDPIYFDSKKHSIPVVTAILSWDNLTSKGIIHQGYNLVMVWNEIMRQEVLTMYPNYKPEQVKIIGVPRFDIYKETLPEKFERKTFLKKIGLDPQKRVLFFANSATRLFKNQPQVIRHLCEALHSGQLPNDVQLLIRCHPHDDLKLYEPFRSLERVSVWPEHPEQFQSTMYNSIPPVDDLWTLYATLKHSAVCIHPASTIALEAAACDIPIIGVAYDGDEILPYEESFANVYEYSHQKVFVDHGAMVVCHSKDELITNIIKALDNPTERQKERSTVANCFLSFETRSIPRMVDAILSVQ